MVASTFFFYLFASMAIGFSGLLILKKNPVVSALSLVMVFFAFAGIYALLGAHLVAALQILVYAGAIMVLFVFVIMLLGADMPSLDLKRTSLPIKLVLGLMIAIFSSSLIWVFKKSVLPPAGLIGSSRIVMDDTYIQAHGGNTQVISELLFSEYILPFELTSVLLIAAVVGAVAIAMRKPRKKETAS